MLHIVHDSTNKPKKLRAREMLPISCTSPVEKLTKQIFTGFDAIPRWRERCFSPHSSGKSFANLLFTTFWKPKVNYKWRRDSVFKITLRYTINYKQTLHKHEHQIEYARSYLLRRIHFWPAKSAKYCYINVDVRFAVRSLLYGRSSRASMHALTSLIIIVARILSI